MFKKATNNYSYIGIGIGIGRYENFDIGILSVSADKEKGIIGPISVSADIKKVIGLPLQPANAGYVSFEVCIKRLRIFEY